MKTRAFSFELPRHLIAQEPPEKRGESRLMTLDRKSRAISHCRVTDLPALLEPEDLLVFNNSKVRKARLLATAAATGSGAEFLLLKRLDAHRWEALVRFEKRRDRGGAYVLPDGRTCEAERGADRWAVRFEEPVDEAWIERYGHVPLPPYITRSDTEFDSERYQTVYAKTLGSAAAPTAGLHITEAMLDGMRERGIGRVFITLHVGLGTFLPVRTENAEDHRIHEESFSIGDEEAAAIEDAKAAGRRIVAVGTTSARALEAAWQGGALVRGEQAASVFIYPGYDFKVVSGLFTNFHTPCSTLLMLVSAFAGREFVLESYGEAIRAGYRFFSYGDAMLIG
ncbi:MAG: tRNA preQ1(34) S-adenosylmethionine ribosyltransferase-isomerase QueA [Spirochaetaceae bacterium]|nr:tRNA preQ1(34) S-adenosylmethionine ribosyltransferase-isomerase QueA [Spirochaetaceae bacterium]